MEQPDISLDIKNTLLGQLFLSRDMSDSQKALFYDDETYPKHIATTPLSLSLPNPSFDELIQYSVTDSYISRNTYIQLVFTSSDSLGEFPKFLKTFATSGMDYPKDISFRNSINFDEFTKTYDHSSGGQKIQTKPADTCKCDGAQLVVSKISPLRPLPEASNYLSYIFGRFEIEDRNHLRLSESQPFLKANDCQLNPETQVIIKFIRDLY